MPKPGNQGALFLCLFLTKYSLCASSKRGDYQSKYWGISHNNNNDNNNNNNKINK